jgi:hypothetical protein
MCEITPYFDNLGIKYKELKSFKSFLNTVYKLKIDPNKTNYLEYFNLSTIFVKCLILLSTYFFKFNYLMIQISRVTNT